MITIYQHNGRWIVNVSTPEGTGYWTGIEFAHDVDESASYATEKAAGVIARSLIGSQHVYSFRDACIEYATE